MDIVDTNASQEKYITHDTVLQTWTYVFTYHKATDNIVFTIWEKQNVNILMIVTDSQIDFSFCHKEWSTSDISIIYAWYPNTKIKSMVRSELNEDNTTSDVILLSLLWNKSDMHVDGTILLSKDKKNMTWHLHEHNVIVGKGIKIKTLPMLDVHSSQVSASHGCKIDTVDEKKLFYMSSKGIPKEQAHGLIVSWHIQTLFDKVADASWEHPDLVGKKDHLLDLIWLWKISWEKK